MSTRRNFEFANLDRDTLQGQVYQQLRTALMSGALVPGQIVSNRSLADKLGVSPMPVRDAIRRLTTERALEVLPNRSVIVPELTPERIDEIYKIRMNLEGMATQLAARNISKGAVEKLAEDQQKMEAQLSSGELAEYLEANWKFHFTIYSASELPLLIDLIEGLWLQIGPSVSRQRPEQRLTTISEHHGHTIEALFARDGVKAKKAIQNDIRAGGKALKAALDQLSEEPSVVQAPRRGRPKSKKAED